MIRRTFAASLSCGVLCTVLLMICAGCGPARKPKPFVEAVKHGIAYFARNQADDAAKSVIMRFSRVVPTAADEVAAAYVRSVRTAARDAAKSTALLQALMGNPGGKETLLLDLERQAAAAARQKAREGAWKHGVLDVEQLLEDLSEFVEEIAKEAAQEAAKQYLQHLMEDD